VRIMQAERKGAEDSRPKELRNFGLTVGVAFGIFGALALWRGKAFYPVLLVISAAFLILAAAVPPVLKPVHKVWMSAAGAMGWFMTRVILVLLFFIALTPVAVIARLAGKRFLDQEIDRSRKSYWIRREDGEPQQADYEKQF
jgi:hypothetical protein